jgi:hypothetical protein
MKTMFFSVWARDDQDIFAIQAYPPARRVGLNGKKSNPLSGRLIFLSTLKLQERLTVR